MKQSSAITDDRVERVAQALVGFTLDPKGAAKAALEASGLTGGDDAITGAMFEAGNNAQHPDDCTDVRDIYLAMRAALPQAPEVSHD